MTKNILVVVVVLVVVGGVVVVCCGFFILQVNSLTVGSGTVIVPLFTHFQCSPCVQDRLYIL